MIRIFMIGYSYEKGGIESYISNLVAQLDPNEYEIVFNMPEMIIRDKIWKRPANRHNYLYYYLFWKKFFKENHFDVLYLNECDIVSIDYLKFGKSAGIPVRIIHSHSTGSQLFIDKKQSLFHKISEMHNRRNLDKYASNLFACSKDAGDWMFDGRPCDIIRNGINISKYKYNENTRKELRHKFGFVGKKLVGIIGRIVAPKNPSFAVNVINELILNDPDYMAVFIGDGNLKKTTETYVKKLRMNNVIKFIGAVDNVNEWLSAIDVLLMPSIFEGLPFILVEAQAAGVPCVVSSSVSLDANISGDLKYVSLNEPLNKWAQYVSNAIYQERRDNEEVLISSGYSIEDTANRVSCIIKKSLGERC